MWSFTKKFNNAPIVKTVVSSLLGQFVFCVQSCNIDLMPFLWYAGGVTQLPSWLQQVDRQGLREEAVPINHLPTVTLTETLACTFI